VKLVPDNYKYAQVVLAVGERSSVKDEEASKEAINAVSAQSAQSNRAIHCCVPLAYPGAPPEYQGYPEYP
jgi:hypothetical protein